MVERLALTMLGPVESRLGDRAIATGSQTLQRLTCLLALSNGGVEDRGRIAALLWPEADEAKARHNLRQSVHQLRAQIGPDWPGLRSERDRVILEPEASESDVARITAALEAGEIPDAIIDTPHLPDQLLAGLAERGTLWSDWLRLRRRELERGWRSTLQDLCASPDTTERAALALLSLDPSDERAARDLIRHYAHRGDPSRALQVYAQLWDTLARDFDTEPTEQTQALIARVKTDAEHPPTEAIQAMAPALPAAPKARLRVGIEAPVASDLSAEDRIFRQELIACLPRFREIEVIDLAAGGQEADFGLSLDLARVGEATVALVILTRRANGTVIWSWRQALSDTNWWQGQAALIERIAAACNVELSRARLDEIAQTGGAPSAVDAWLSGEAKLHQFRPAPWRDAERDFRTSIDLDPNYSRAYSSLAQLKNAEHLVFVGLHRRMEVHREARALASQAIALDPWDARAYLHRGWASCLARDYGSASASFQMARDLNPADPWTLISSALGAAFGNEIDLALRLAGEMDSRGWTTAPQHWGYHATIRFVAGDLEGCLAAAAEGGERLINVAGWQAAALWLLGRPEEAAGAWRRLLELSRDQWSVASPHDASTVADWFLSCFPIRDTDRAAALSEGLNAARAYAH